MSRSKKTSNVTVTEVDDEDNMQEDEKKIQGVSGFINKIYKVSRKDDEDVTCGGEN